MNKIHPEIMSEYMTALNDEIASYIASTGKTSNEIPDSTVLILRKIAGNRVRIAACADTLEILRGLRT